MPKFAGMEFARKAYPSDVSDDEWALVAPYLTLLPEDAGQRAHSLRDVFNGLRYIIKTSAQWRWMPHDLPPWAAVYQQAQRWLAAGCFEALADDLRAVLRQATGRSAEPSAAVIDSRTLRSSPESGTRGGYDGAKRKKGSKLHMAVDTLGNLLALHVTPANTDDRAAVGRLLEAVQDATGGSVETAFADQGYTGVNGGENLDLPHFACCRFGLGGVQDSLPEEVEASAAIHGSFQHFQPVDLSLCWAGCPRHIERGLHSTEITAQASNKPLQRCSGRVFEHRIQAFRAVAAYDLVQPLCHRDAVGEARHLHQQPRDKGLLSLRHRTVTHQQMCDPAR